MTSLLTKELKEKAEAQWNPNASIEVKEVVARFHNPASKWSWYLIEMDPEDEGYCFGIVEGFVVEMGYFTMQELEANCGHKLFGISRDEKFQPTNARELLAKLKGGLPENSYREREE